MSKGRFALERPCRTSPLAQATGQLPERFLLEDRM